MLFALGFVALFTIGGLSGIFLAAFPFDWQAHDSYFVVAHLHYVLFGGSMFGIFARALLLVAQDLRAHARRAAREVAFLAALHRLQPRVLPAAHARSRWECRGGSTRTARRSWETYNLISTIGAFVMGGRDARVRGQRDLDEEPAGRARPATTRGSATRSSGTRPRPRRRTTSTRFPT